MFWQKKKRWVSLSYLYYKVWVKYFIVNVADQLSLNALIQSCDEQSWLSNVISLFEGSVQQQSLKDESAWTAGAGFSQADDSDIIPVETLRVTGVLLSLPHIQIWSTTVRSYKFPWLPTSVTTSRQLLLLLKSVEIDDDVACCWVSPDLDWCIK